MQRLTEKLGDQMAKGAELDGLIRQKLEGWGMSSDWCHELTIAQFIAKDGGAIKTGPFGTALKVSEYLTE